MWGCPFRDRSRREPLATRRAVAERDLSATLLRIRARAVDLARGKNRWPIVAHRMARAAIAAPLRCGYRNDNSIAPYCTNPATYESRAVDGSGSTFVCVEHARGFDR